MPGFLPPERARHRPVAHRVARHRPDAAGAIVYQLISRDGRRPLPARVIGNQDMFALDDFARVFELTVREDAAAGGVTVAARGQTIVLSAGQPLASVRAIRNC